VSVPVAGRLVRFSDVHAGSGGVGALGDAEVDPHPPSVQLLSVALLLRLHRVVLMLEIHEAETARPASLLIENNVYGVDVAILFENSPQFPLCCVQTQTKNSEALAWSRIQSVSDVPSPVRHG